MDSQTFLARYGTSPQNVQTALVIRAWKDDEFRARLLREPKAAIKEECRIELPPDFDVRVVEVTESYLPVVIPEPSPDQKSASVEEIAAELTPADEEQPAQVRDQMLRQARLLVGAWNDAGFRQELVRAPRQVLERELGMQIPEGVRVETLEDSAMRGHLILPANPNVEGGELSDAQLETVAGGITPTVVVASVGVSLVVTLSLGGSAYLLLGGDTDLSNGNGGLSGLGW